MSAKKTDQGEVETITQIGEGTQIGFASAFSSISQIAHVRSPKTPGGEGLQVTMLAIPGLTAPGILQTPFFFQCPPHDQFAPTYSFSYGDFDTVSHGQMTQPQGRQLATVSFDTLFVDYDATWTTWKRVQLGQNEVAGTAIFTPTSGDTSAEVKLLGAKWAPDPLKLVDELRRILESGTPFEFVIGQPALWGRNDLHWGPATENAASLRSLTPTERAGELDARYVNVQFVEYRHPSLLRKLKGTAKTRGASTKLPTSVWVYANGGCLDEHGHAIPGIDSNVSPAKFATLDRLAKHFYGSVSNWRQIAKASGITNFASSRSLGEYVKKRKEKRLKVKIPKLVGRVVGTAAGQGASGDWTTGSDG